MATRRCACAGTALFPNLSGMRYTRRLPTDTLFSRPHSASGSRRYASTSRATASRGNGLKLTVYGGGLATLIAVIYLYTTDTRAFVHRYVVPPALRLMYPDAEDAHHAGSSALKLLHKLNLHPRERGAAVDNAQLQVSVFGNQLSNPIGISAGLDKDAEIPDALFALGAGIVEVGGCTPLAQAGNPRPRMFRVPTLDGLVNRYGLNSLGADDMARRLRSRVRAFARAMDLNEEDVLNGKAGVPAGSLLPGRLLAVQIAKNKETDGKDEKAVAKDYVYCVSRLAQYADILVVNVSSPNTPGLRDLQATEPLTRLLRAVVAEAAKTHRARPPKVMVKVSPDEDEDAQVEGIVEAVHLSGVDGVIVGNTTKRRSGVIPEGARLTAREQRALMEEGGYSGPAMFSRTLDLVSRYRQKLDSYTLDPAAMPAAGARAGGRKLEQKVIFATGGICNGDQALKVLNAGASVAQVYTGLVYGGAGTITRIKSEMREQM